MGAHPRKAWRSGVSFACERCGRLWKDDPEHSEIRPNGCPSCGEDLWLVGAGDPSVGRARWFRCRGCMRLYMFRRGELVETKPRSGFEEFTRF
jgi:hypothetical protein